MNILFVCQYNQLRSKIAEDFFNQFNKDMKHSARSAGILSGNVINRDLVRWADRIIVVADNVNPLMIEQRFGKKVDYWKIPSDARAYREIEEKVKNLVDGLIGYGDC